MRFSVSYRFSSLDLSYRMKVYSLIKQAVLAANSRYYEKIFIQSENQIKPFRKGDSFFDVETVHQRLPVVGFAMKELLVLLPTFDKSVL